MKKKNTFLSFYEQSENRKSDKFIDLLNANIWSQNFETKAHAPCLHTKQVTIGFGQQGHLTLKPFGQGALL